MATASLDPTPDVRSLADQKDDAHAQSEHDALTILNLATVYDADPRPTFILDTTQSTFTDILIFSHVNVALSQHKDLLAYLEGARSLTTGFSSWALSINSKELYYRYGGALWFAFTLQGKWKIVSTVSSYSAAEPEVEDPFNAFGPQSPSLSGDEYALYEATIHQLKSDIRAHELGHKQAAIEKESHYDTVQHLKDELRASDTILSRPGISRGPSETYIPTIGRRSSRAYQPPRDSEGTEHEMSQRYPVAPEVRQSSLDQIVFDQSLSRLIMPLRKVTANDDEDAMTSLDKFQRLAEAVDVGFFDYDTDGRLLHANDSWYALSGHPREPEAHTPLTFSKCVYPDDLEMVTRKWETLLQGQPVTFEMRWAKHSPGSSLDVQWVLSACVPVLDKDGRVKSISGCTTDINAQKLTQEVAVQRAEALERARASEERFARFAEVTPIAIFRFDRHKNIEYCNDRWFEMTGIPKARFSDITWPFGVFEDDVKMCSQAWEQSIAERSLGQIEFRLQKDWHDNHGRRGQAWVYCTFFPEFSEDGTFKGLLGSLLDISHLKWAENMQKLRAEEALEAKRQQENFIDITSHEMRNPLSAMVQCADTIMVSFEDISRLEARTRHLTGDENRALMQEYVSTGLDAVETILSCAAHQKRIVDDILTLSKLDSNLLLITPIKTDPVEVVQNVIKMFEMDSTKAGLELVRELDPSFRDLDIRWLMLDPSRVSQILINLLGNAIKFTKTETTKKVTVRMSASLEPPSKSDTLVDYVPAEAVMDSLDGSLGRSSHQPIYLRFEVHDTGRGLTAEEKEKLFIRFSQASPKTHVQYGGSGLGLFISRKLTEMQGGEIGFASEADVGSRFAFYVKTRRTGAPVVEGQLNIADLTSDDGSQNAKGAVNRNLNVLLVEDNLVNQKVLTKQLRRHGCTVFVAGHGVEAIDFLKSTEVWAKQTPAEDGIPMATGSSIDVVLMDIEMPVMGGLECTRKIREFEKEKLFTRHLPVISISANARQEQVNEAKFAGVDDTITKPFRIKELMPKLYKLATFRRI